MSEEIVKLVGTISVSGNTSNNIIAMDPCCSYGTWCTHEFSLKPGAYDCYISTIPEGNVKRVKEAFIVKHNLNLDNITFCVVSNVNIGVDSGQCGFYLLNGTPNKTLCTETEYHKICNNTADKDWSITDKGFFTSSGYGDGCYRLSISNTCDAAKLVYIDDEELE